MGWSVSFYGTPDELIDKIDNDPTFPLHQDQAPSYAKSRFAELREACRMIAMLGVGDSKSTISLTGSGHSNGTVAEGGDGQDGGSLSWSFGRKIE